MASHRLSILRRELLLPSRRVTVISRIVRIRRRPIIVLLDFLVAHLVRLVFFLLFRDREVLATASLHVARLTSTYSSSPG